MSAGTVRIFSLLFVAGAVFFKESVVLADRSYNLTVGEMRDITEFGVTKRVTNNCSNRIFVPTNTSLEWDSFYNNPPACVTVANAFMSDFQLTDVIIVKTPAVPRADIDLDIRFRYWGQTIFYNLQISTWVNGQFLSTVTLSFNWPDGMLGRQVQGEGAGSDAFNTLFYSKAIVGVNEVTVRLDPSNAISENDETNNEITRYVTLP